MRFPGRLKTAVFLLAFSMLAVPWKAVDAHDGNAHSSAGLSEAARLASTAPVLVGPTESRSGRYHIIFGDVPSGSGIPAISGYVLIVGKLYRLGGTRSGAGATH